MEPVWKTLHATALWWHGCGLVLVGPSRSGKSDLALRLIYEAGARLIGDDVCQIRVTPQGVVVRGMPEGARLLEVRGLGLIKLETHQWVKEAPLSFGAHLMPQNQISPEREPTSIEGTAVPLYPLDPFGTSALARLRLLVAVAHEQASLTCPELCLPLAS